MLFIACAWYIATEIVDGLNLGPEKEKDHTTSFYLIASNLFFKVLTNNPQVEVGQGKKAIIIFVPVPLLQGFHKIQQR